MLTCRLAEPRRRRPGRRCRSRDLAGVVPRRRCRLPMWWPRRRPPHPPPPFPPLRHTDRLRQRRLPPKGGSWLGRPSATTASTSTRRFGFEEIDALGGARHDYPTETFLTVQPGGCGTISRWTALAERWDSQELCAGSDGMVVASYDSFHQWFGRADLQQFSCEPGEGLQSRRRMEPGLTPVPTKTAQRSTRSRASAPTRSRSRANRCPCSTSG